MELFLVSLFVFLGALLLLVEVALVPGLGLTGILGVVSFIVSVAYAFVVLGATAGWVTFLAVLALVVFFILWSVYGKPFKRLALKTNIESTVKAPDAAAVAVGDEGVALTRLALVGAADFGKVQIDVTSADGFIDEGAAVYVSRITESTIFVKRK
ncbi:MAG: NfeD family protein [Bacteroidaceae bacterium]|nr:NfeD family protein [Bacteroidaceae bacterium]